MTKLLTMGLDRRKANQLNLDDAIEWETKTITSAVKTFFRNLPGRLSLQKFLIYLGVCDILFISEPIMTFSLHSRFIEAAKCDSYSRRLSQVPPRTPPNRELFFMSLHLRSTGWYSSCLPPIRGCLRSSSLTWPTWWTSLTRTS